MKKADNRSPVGGTYEKIILGIDPGTNIMGYGLICINGKNAGFVHMDVLVMNKLPAHFLKLKRIFEQTLHIIDTYKPDEVALEAPFFGKNVQSMLKLGRAQGISMAAALHRNLPVFEYSPRKVKQSITGKGTSSKEQVATMLHSILTINQSYKKLDATDALAVAVCHHFQCNMALQAGKASNKAKGGNKPVHNTWEAFVAANKDRISTNL